MNASLPISSASAEELREFRDALSDQLIQLERQIARLRQEPRDAETIAGLFRTLHTLKGDAALCHFELGVAINHPLETALARVREGHLAFTPLLADAILLASDRLEMACEAIIAQRPLDSLRLDVLIAQLELLAASRSDPLDREAAALIEAVTGFRPHDATAQSGGAPMVSAERKEDLEFLHRVALQFEARSPLFQGRTRRLLDLALATNAHAGNPVDPLQLEAAICVHDLGMLMLPESFWLKNSALSADERQQLQQHPLWIAGFVRRMNGWQEAAEIIAQHHEMADGRGYPLGLKEADIVPGAKILAIVDAFEAITLKHAQRGAERSLLRAMAEINASDRQFSAEWIVHFNAVVRAMAS